MLRKHDNSGLRWRQVHEVPNYIASSTLTDWNRYLARDPPSYDSGILLPEAVAKTMMDKIKARSKWLKAKRPEVKFRKKWLKAKAHEVPKHCINAWNRYLARDPPSYDSGTFLSEADAKIMMDKIEARSKWLKANGKRQQFGKHQRAILARAKFKADDDSGIPRQQAHEVSTHTVRNWYRYLARDNNPKAFRAIYLFPLHGESETDLRNIWAAMQQLRNISATSGRAAYKSCPSSHDYSKLKAVFQQYKEANTNWKDILLAYRAEKIRDWNRRWHAIRRAMTVEHSYRGMNTLIKACTSGTLRSRPVTKDIGYAKTMMDKIETRTKWLNANGRARQLEKHQRAIQQHKNAPEDSHTSSLMRR